MNNVKKILAINFGGIGDEIFFLPTLISLKKTYPSAEITLALEPRSRGIKDLTDIISDIILIDIKGKHKYSELLKLVLEARRRRFDMVVSSGGNKLIAVLLALMGIKQRYGYDTGGLSQKLLTKAVKLNKNQYACAMYHDLITPVSQFKTELPQIVVNRGIAEPNTVLIHPGVSKLSVEKGMIKTIDAETWAKTIDLLAEGGKKVVLTGGPDDVECIETIRNTVKTKDYVDKFGQTKNLKELAELISTAEIFLCSDSAPLHIAVALDVRTFAIFGPTDDLVLLPQSERFTAVKVADSCPLKPCLWARRNQTCESLDCLKITAEMVVKHILNA